MRKLTSLRSAPYLTAFAAVLLATIARALLDPLLGARLPYIPYTIVSIAVCWRWGLGPGLLVLTLGGALGLYLFVPPRYSVMPSTSAEVAALAVYLLVGALVLGVIEAMRRGQQSIAMRERLLQTTLASIGDAVISTDLHGHVVFLNRSAEGLTGWRADEALGRPLADVFHIQAEEPTGSPADAAAGPTRQSHSAVLISRDGIRRVIDESAATITDTLGKVSGMVIVFRDISGPRIAERERQEAQEQVIAILESIPDAFMRIDAAGRIVQVNSMFEHRFDKPHAALLGQDFRKFDPDLCRGELEKCIVEALARREVIEMECRDEARDCWYAFKLCPTGVSQLSVFIQDITARKHTESELRDSQQRERERAGELEAVLRATPAAVFIAHDPYCHAITGNPASYRILGLPERANVSASAPERLPEARGFREFRDGVPLQPEELPLQIAASTGRDVENAELTLAFEDGRVCTIYGNAAPLFGPNGERRGAISAFVDITALKQAQQQLQEADRRKDEFLATLAHELRNPLAPISNAAQFLKLRGPVDASLGWGIDVISRQVQTMARLLDDLLDVSRISRNKLILQRQRIDLAAVVARAVETSRPLIDAAGHEFTVSLPTEPVLLDADPMRLAQVLSNLLNNAAKYTDSGGHIRLVAAKHGEEVEVSVEDDGVGIAPDMLPRLFQIFSQAEPALERSRGGLGIGLSLVRGLVEMHGGTITAYSAGVGRGSRFTLRLPVQTPQAERLAAAPAHDAAPTPAYIGVLVADDNHDSADTMALMLEAVGYQVFVAYDGAQAITLAQEHRPAAAVLDIGMPRRNGYEVCQHLRAQPWGADMFLIALTGWGQEADRLRATSAGFDQHLVKPVEPGAILDLLARLHDGDRAAGASGENLRETGSN